MGPEILHNPYHVPIVRLRLTRNIEALFPEMIDEIVTAFDDVLDLRGNGELISLSCVCAIDVCLEHLEWKSVSALSNIQKVVCRTSNRAFVGLPLCEPCGRPLFFVSCFNYSRS